MSQLQKHAVVFGISVDTVASHLTFATAEHLNFPLLADPDHRVTEEYGILAPNGLAKRVTFVIGPDGKIAAIDRAVNSQFSRTDNGLITRHALNLALLLSNWKAKLGGPVPNFSVLSYDGNTLSLLNPPKKATAILFLSSQCPASLAYGDRIRALVADPALQDVAFLGIDSNANETTGPLPDSLKFPFPVGRDRTHEIADHFNATRTPEVWVVDAKGIAVYHGAIDNSDAAAAGNQPLLKNALEDVLAGRPVAVAQTPVMGCTIRRR